MIPCNKSRDMAINIIFKKTELQRPLSRYVYTNFTNVFSNIMYLCKYFYAILVTISRDMSTKRILEKTEFQRPLVRYVPKVASSFFLIAYILYKNFCTILSNRNRDLYIPPPKKLK